MSTIPDTASPALPASLPWVERLVRIPSVSGTSNLEIIDLLEQQLTRHGVQTFRTFSEDGERANLFGTLPDREGRTEGGIVVSGHTDVVPVEGQPWDTDPFEPTVQGTRLYGRGVADMKSYLATALHVLPEMAAAELSRPIHFAFSYDEEPGCLGAPRMIEELQARGIRPEHCIVGEPSLMRVIQAHKSPQRGRITFRGVPKHSSMATYGVNAVHYAGEFIHFYKTMAEQWRDAGPFDEGFAIPHTTGGVNFVRGGIAFNIVAEECVLEYDFRAIPATPNDALRQQIQDFLFGTLEPAMREDAERVRRLGGADEAALERVGIEFELMADVPGLDTADDSPTLHLGLELGGLRGDEEHPTRVPYGTEAGQFHQAGIPAVVCGPGDIAQAHTANEWIELEQIRASEEFMRAVLRWSQQ